MDEERTRLMQVFIPYRNPFLVIRCLKKSRLELSKITERQLEEIQKNIVKINEDIRKNNRFL